MEHELTPEQEEHVASSALMREMMADPLMEPYQVAKLLRVSTKTVTRWAAKGLIEHVVLPGKHRRIRRSVVLDLMLTNKNAEGADK